MAQSLNKLSARFVSTTTEPGRHGDGGGLWLMVSPTGTKRFAFIYRIAGRWREMGLGSASDVTLARARELATEARALIATGGDPLEERRRKEAAAEKVVTIPTFGEAAAEYVRTHQAGWRNPKHADQWRSTLGIVEPKAAKVRTEKKAQAAHLAALKRLRALRVDLVEVHHVVDVLKPIWSEKPETASRLRGRIEAVLDAAKAQKHRGGENPAVWKGNLAELLPKRKKLSRGHHAAMGYEDVPDFVERLRAVGSVSALAMEFAILTAARSGEVMGATWSEIDEGARLWTVPGDRMKSGREHRVPLTDPAMAILATMRQLRTGDHIFPGTRGKGLSVMALAMAVRRLGSDATPHGFRSSFRDWAGEETPFPREVAEAALAHVVGDETERAYRRGDALEKRRRLMEAWAGYLAPKQDAEVIPITRKISKRRTA